MPATARWKRRHAGARAGSRTGRSSTSRRIGPGVGDQASPVSSSRMNIASPVGIGDRIVRERRQPVLAAVLRPGERRARRRHDRAERRVRDHVRPRQRRFAIAVEDDDVFRPSAREAAEAVEQAQRRRLERRRLRRADAAACARARSGRAAASRRRRRERADRAGWPACRGRRAGRRARRSAAASRSASGMRSAAQEIHAAGPVLPAAPRAVVEQRRELLVHLVEVARPDAR